MQKPPAGAERHADRLHRAPAHATTTSRMNRLSIRAARAIQDTVHGRAAETSASIATRSAAGLRTFSAPDRLLPISVATIVAVASLLAVLPSTPQGAVGGTEGSGTSPRLAINGGVDGLIDPGRHDQVAAAAIGFDGVIDRDEPCSVRSPSRASVDTKAGAEQSTIDPAPVLDDGTLLTPVRADTEVEDGADLIETYKVKSGDTLSDIAHHFGVSMMTLWWANKLKSKDDLHIGQVLRIPPVTGLVYTVKDTDTLDSLAAAYNVSAQHIIEAQRARGPDARRGPGARPPRRQGRADPDPQAHAQARQQRPAAAAVAAAAVAAGRRGGGPSTTTAASSTGRSSAAATTSASTSTTATRRSTSRPTTAATSSRRPAGG